MVAAIIAAIPAIIGLINMIVNAIKETPVEKRIDYINELSEAMKKAKNENNPEDLARLISKL